MLQQPSEGDKTAIPDPEEYNRMVKFVLDQDVDPFDNHTLH